MNPVLDILKYSLEGGFWHFVGCAFLLSIGVAGATAVLQTVVAIVVAPFGGLRRHKKNSDHD